MIGVPQSSQALIARLNAIAGPSRLDRPITFSIPPPPLESPPLESSPLESPPPPDLPPPSDLTPSSVPARDETTAQPEPSSNIKSKSKARFSYDLTSEVFETLAGSTNVKQKNAAARQLISSDLFNFKKPIIKSAADDDNTPSPVCLSPSALLSLLDSDVPLIDSIAPDNAQVSSISSPAIDDVPSAQISSDLGRQVDLPDDKVVSDDIRYVLF